MTPERLAEIKKIRNCVPFIDNGTGVPETQAAIDDLLADNAALREAVRVLQQERDGWRVRWSRHVTKGDAMTHPIIEIVQTDANPLAAASVREAKEQS